MSSRLILVFRRIVSGSRVVALAGRPGPRFRQPLGALIVDFVVFIGDLKRIHRRLRLVDLFRARACKQSRQNLLLIAHLSFGLGERGGKAGVIQRRDQLAHLDGVAFLHEHPSDGAAVVKGRLDLSDIHVAVQNYKGSCNGAVRAEIKPTADPERNRQHQEHEQSLAGGFNCGLPRRRRRRRGSLGLGRRRRARRRIVLAS